MQPQRCLGLSVGGTDSKCVVLLTGAQAHQVWQGLRCLVGRCHLLCPSLGLSPFLHGEPKTGHLPRDEAQNSLGRVHLSSRPVESYISGGFQINSSELSTYGHQDAKDLIKGCLRSNPEERLSIEEMLASTWLSKHISVPPTPLLTSKVLQQGNANWKLLQV